MKKIAKKIFLIISTVTLSLGVCGGVGYLIYDQVTRNSNNQTDFVLPSEDPLSKTNKKLQTSFLNNSLKITFQVDDIIGNNYRASQGTAWSWYYHLNSNNHFEWYVMTNYHVVADACKYISEKSSIPSDDGSNNPNNAKYNYLIKCPRGYQFWLEIYNPKFNKYQSIFANEGTFPYPNSIEIITDNLNPNITLFSDENNNYNLDIALVKMTFNTNLSSDFSNIYNNPFQYYLDDSNLFQKKYQENYNKPDTIIVGNPAATKRLTGGLIDNNTWETYETSLDRENNEMLKGLHAPYQVVKNPYANWALTEGASGSAVYQNIDITKLSTIIGAIPSGIYWGGFVPNNKSTNFNPSYVPFISNNTHKGYNVFENFNNVLSSNKI